MDEPVLGVERSFSGKRWVCRPVDDRLALALAQQNGLPDIVGRVLAGRGLSPEEIPAFLEPTLRESLPDPSRLKDMDLAAERFASAIMGGESITVFGDYDVDGATSSALLLRFARAAGGRIEAYIPDRLREGYGPNIEAMRRLKAAGTSLIITVDCGITAFEPLAAARELGLDVVVVDHHEVEPALPVAYAVVDPNRLDEDGSLGQLAAVGVAFLLAVATNRCLRAAGWYRGRSEPDLLSLLDLVSLGTVCDVVPLTGLNRALVFQGLRVMARRSNPGLAALADVAKLDRKPDAYHAGFILGPRINAGGRVGEAGLGARLLSTDDPVEAAAIAQRLDRFNAERQAIEAAVLEEALRRVEAEGGADAFIFVAGEGWHPGVIGIVASRLKERFNRPVVVVALDGEVGKGSGRSISGLDLGAAVIAARQAGLLINGGGHRMAAGLTVSRDRLAALRAFLEERVRAAALSPVPVLGLDAVLSPAAVNVELAETLGRLAPFGVGNAEPCLALSRVRIEEVSIVGNDHVRVGLAGLDGHRVKGIAFRATETGLGQGLLRHRDRVVHVAGHLRPDLWQGRARAQFIIDDAAEAAA